MHRPGMVVAMVSRGGLRRRRGRAGCGLAVRRSGWFRRGVMRCHGGAAAHGQPRNHYEPGRLSGMGERHDLSFNCVICDGWAAAVCTPLTRTVTGCRSAQPPLLDVVSVTDHRHAVPCTAPHSFAGARARGGHARPCSRLEYRFEVDLGADLPEDQEPAAVEGQVPAETPSLAVEGAVGRETARRPSLGATWPRYAACRLTGRVMPQMVSTPASMPRVPCQRAARLERETVGGGGWCRRSPCGEDTHRGPGCRS